MKASVSEAFAALRAGREAALAQPLSAAFAADPGRFARMHADARRSAVRLFQAARHRRGARARCSRWPTRPGSRRGATRCSPAKSSTRPRSARRCIRRCAGRRGGPVDRRRPRLRAARSRRSASACWRSPPTCATGAAAAASASRSPTSSTSASAAPTSARRWRRGRWRPTASRNCAAISSPTSTAPIIGDTLKGLDAGAHAVHRLVEDLHDAGDDDQRALGARLARGGAGRGRGRRPFRRRLDQSRKGARVRHRRPTRCSASGTGSAGAIRSGRASACRSPSPSGRSSFTRVPAGGHDVDEHFRTAPARQNIPLLMGLLSVWNRNVLGYATQAVIPYDQRLGRFPAYLQQLQMESNGKGVEIDGSPAPEATGAGGLGRARHQRAACVLPVDPPGHGDRAGRFPGRGAADLRPTWLTTSCWSPIASRRARR